MKFYLIFLISVISVFLWVFFHQYWKLPKSFLYIKRNLSLTTTTIIHIPFTKYWKINLTEDIRKNLDEGKVGCGFFVDLQRTFGTVDPKILLAKLEHYGIYGVANDRSYQWSCLSQRRQFVSINGFTSNHAMLKHGVPQGCVLGAILFLIYINGLNHVIKYDKVHHFADNTYLLYFNSSTKKLNRLLNLDMKHLPVWLNANKISLNAKKT